MDIRSTLRPLMRRWWTILVLTVLVAGASLVQALLEPPRFTAYTDIVVANERTLSGVTTVEQTFIPEQDLQTQLATLRSARVAERAAEQLGLDEQTVASAVAANVLGATRVVRITATDVDAERTARIAQGVAEAYLAFRHDIAVDRADAAVAELSSRRDAIEDELATIEGRLPQVSDPSQLVSLERRRDLLSTQLGELNVELIIIRSAAQTDTHGGEILRDAETPRQPTSPRPVQDTLIGLLGGLTLGVFAAFVLDLFNERVADAAALADISDRPLLATIPATAGDGVDMLRDPTSAVSEATRTLLTGVRFSMGGARLRSLVVTSALAGEGKTTVAANLAVAAARAGLRVVLVDADLRNPSVARRFGAVSAVGLSHVLSDQSTLQDALQSVGVDNLRLLPAGGVPPDPAEMLGAAGFGDLAVQLASVAELVIYDTAPVVPVADTLAVSTRADGVLVVVDSVVGRQRALRTTLERLDQVQSKVLGLVMNRGRVESDYYYYAASST